MKITFKPLAYQKDAVQAVIDVFGGQERFAHPCLPCFRHDTRDDTAKRFCQTNGFGF